MIQGAVQLMMVWLCGLLPYEQAAGVMARIGKLPVADSSLWCMVQQAGPHLSEQAAAAQGEAVPESTAESAVSA